MRKAHQQHDRNVDFVWKVTLMTIAILSAYATVVQSLSLPPPPTFRIIDNNCECLDRWDCQCCTRLNFPTLNALNQTLCGEWQITPENITLTVDVTWNNNTLLETELSPDNAPPICVPLIPPVLSACIKVSNVTQNLVFTDGTDENHLVGACTNATLRSTVFTLINFRLGCISINRDGIELTNLIEGK